MDRLNAWLDKLCALAAWLALPVAALLAAQPLLRAGGGQPQLANDIAQALFALYVALALRHAWRQGTHLSAPWLARRFGPGYAAGVSRWLARAVMLPWSLGLLALAGPLVMASLQQWERFPETGHPGYWLIKLALAILLLALGLQTLRDALK